ncbi:TPA: phage tail protein [Salmonella enterica subsp. salamae serovar 42:g,t:-]
MANLPETPQWEDGIYQIEVSDPVLGGPDGISNRQGKQLASRTLYLKQQVEKGGTDLAKHIAAADPHTQYAPKASPTFTGTPTAPTPANSDNSKKLATTEFVAEALAALAGSAPETLDTLKELADALGNDPNFATTVLNKLAEKLAKDQNGADIPDPALFVKNLGLGEAATRNVGTGTGQVPDMSSFTTGHSGAADWPIPKSGWSKGPDGVITQWGIFGFPVGQTGTNVVFPLPFPARVESITLTIADIQESLLSPTTMPAYGVNSTGTSRTGFTARMSGVGGFNLCYIAKGR